ATEGASVISGSVDTHDFARAEDGGDGVEAASESLADNQDVGCDALVHVGEELAGATETRLNLIEHQKYRITPADLGSFSEESVRRYDDACFSLYRLPQRTARGGSDVVSCAPR